MDNITISYYQSKPCLHSNSCYGFQLFSHILNFRNSLRFGFYAGKNVNDIKVTRSKILKYLSGFIFLVIFWKLFSNQLFSVPIKLAMCELSIMKWVLLFRELRYFFKFCEIFTRIEILSGSLYHIWQENKEECHKLW